jgi:NTE family protein
MKAQIKAKFSANHGKIGLALGGGGARGLAHIGALKVLAQAGIQPDYIAGTSIGAIIGAWLALGKPLAELETLCLSFDRSKAWRTLVDIGNPRYSILAGHKIKKFIYSLFGTKKFADCQIPLAVVATDLANGREVIIRQGSITRAVLASIAIPGLLPAVRVDRRYLIDGASANITPASVVSQLGAKIIIALDLSVKSSAHFTAKPKLFTTLMQSYTIIREQSIKYQLSRLKGQDRTLILVQPAFTDIIDTFEFDQTADFIKLGEEAMRHRLPVIRRALVKPRKI